MTLEAKVKGLRSDEEFYFSGVDQALLVKRRDNAGDTVEVRRFERFQDRVTGEPRLFDINECRVLHPKKILKSLNTHVNAASNGALSTPDADNKDQVASAHG